MRSSRLVIALVSASALVAFACSDSSSSSNGAADSGSFVDQYCQMLSSCCAKVNRPTDGAQCRALAGAVGTGKTYDAQKGTECLNELKVAQQDPKFCDTLDTPDSCSHVYGGAGGSVAPGGTCENDSDCASSPEGDVRCHSTYDNGAETRTCQVQIPGKAGDTPCLGTKDGDLTSYVGSSPSGDAGSTTPSRGYICDVADGVHCDSQTKACAPIPKVGEPCSSGGSYGCTKDAYCDFSQKTCVARVAVGGDCATTSGSDVCADKAYCDTATKKCVAGIADGQPCTTSNECASKSCVNKKCNASGSSSLGLALLCGTN